MNASERYVQLLGIEEFPQSPQHLPQKVNLLAESLGDLERAILETSAQGNEFLQKIYWRNNRFIKANLYTGTRSTVDGGVVDFLSSYFWLKPLIDFHTHTTDEDERASYEFSISDVAHFRAYPRDSFIDLCGSRLGIVAMLQTDQSASLPFCSFVEITKIVDKLTHLDFELMPQVKQAKILEDLGYGYYIWRPRRKRVYAGDLNNGIYLTRIQSGGS